MSDINNRKILYITFANKENATGGGQCAKRNMQTLTCIFGTQNVREYIIQPVEKRSAAKHFERFIGICRGYMGGLTRQHIDQISDILEKNVFTDVFIDSSQLGLLAKRISRKHPRLRIYTFFHNVEYDYMRSVTIGGNDYFHIFWIYGAWINEACACKHSDVCIALNDCDANRLKRLYHRHIDAIVPITMRDNYYDMEPKDIESVELNKKHALFVGSYFPGNVMGLKWFCKDILPHVNLHLTIVGSGMDALANDIDVNENISLFSYVEDLKSFYEAADFVLLPIISGGGMKVKTAESLMYGKYIIGTPEALEGYDVNPSIATICKSREDFIQVINNNPNTSKYNVASRSLFKQHYSFDVSLSLFNKIMKI